MPVVWTDPDAVKATQQTHNARVVVRDVDLTVFASELERPYTAEQWQGFLETGVPDSNREWGRQSLIYFTKHYLWNHVYNRFSEAHFALMRELQDSRPCKRDLFLFPREHAKSSLVTFAYILWCICYEIKENIVIYSDVQTQATEFLRNIKTELETNVRLIEDFGNMVGSRKWHEQHVITSNNIQIKARSPNTPARGLVYNKVSNIKDPKTGRSIKVSKSVRPDLMILDDIIADKHVRNKQVRDQIETWFFGELINALDSENGDMIIIGTVLHGDDLLERIWKDAERTSNWKKTRIPACKLVDENTITDILWPDRWPAKKLLERRITIGSLAFAREFLLTPLDEKSRFFRREWFKYYVDWTVPQNKIMDLVGIGVTALPEDLLLVTSIDPNTKKKDDADYTVVATIGFSPRCRAYYVLDATRDRPSPEGQVNEMIRQAMAWGRQYRPDGKGWVHLAFCVETVAYQESIRYWLKKAMERRGINESRIFSRSETVDKLMRASMMSPMVEQGRLYFPLSWQHSPLDGRTFVGHSLGWLEDEMADFPAGAYDDGVDAVQRAYSVLVKTEKQYIYGGTYGPMVTAQWQEYVRHHGLVEKYLQGD